MNLYEEDCLRYRSRTPGSSVNPKGLKHNLCILLILQAKTCPRTATIYAEVKSVTVCRIDVWLLLLAISKDTLCMKMYLQGKVARWLHLTACLLDVCAK